MDTSLLGIKTPGQRIRNDHRKPGPTNSMTFFKKMSFMKTVGSRPVRILLPGVFS